MGSFSDFLGLWGFLRLLGLGLSCPFRLPDPSSSSPPARADRLFWAARDSGRPPVSSRGQPNTSAHIHPWVTRYPGGLPASWEGSPVTASSPFPAFFRPLRPLLPSWPLWPFRPPRPLPPPPFQGLRPSFLPGFEASLSPGVKASLWQARPPLLRGCPRCRLFACDARGLLLPAGEQGVAEAWATCPAFSVFKAFSAFLALASPASSASLAPVAPFGRLRFSRPFRPSRLPSCRSPPVGIDETFLVLIRVPGRSSVISRAEKVPGLLGLSPSPSPPSPLCRGSSPAPL